jgi:hypothetical protein
MSYKIERGKRSVHIMAQKVDLRNFVEDEYCQDVKEVATKVGVTVVCDDEDEVEEEGLHVQNFDGCDNMKETASKFGVSVVCDDED